MVNKLQNRKTFQMHPLATIICVQSNRTVCFPSSSSVKVYPIFGVAFPPPSGKKNTTMVGAKIICISPK